MRIAAVRTWRSSGSRKCELVDQALVPGHHGIGDSNVHQRPRAGKLRGGDVGAVGKEGSDPLVVDAFGPTCANQIRKGKMKQEVAQRCGVEHARVIHRDKARHESVTHSGFLCLLGQFCERLFAANLGALAIGEQIFELKSPMGSDFAIGQAARYDCLLSGAAHGHSRAGLRASVWARSGVSSSAAPS